jgi:hypothetical protein
MGYTQLKIKAYLLEKTETEVHGNKFFFFKKKDKQMESFSILYSGQNA